MIRPTAIGWIAVAILCAATPDWSSGASVSDAAAEAASLQDRNTRSRSNNQRSRNSSAQELRRLNGRIASVQAQNDSLQVRVAELEKALQSFAEVVPELRKALGETLNSKAVMDSAELALVNQLTLVLNKTSLLEDKAAYIDSTNFEILSQLVLVENKIVSLTNSFNDIMAARTPGQSRASASKISDEEFRSQYIKSLTKYQNGQYREAREQFAALINGNKEHELADNAQYWLAECFYAAGNYKRAISEFEKVFSYRGTDKADHAQFKIGVSFWNAGEYASAKTAMEKLLAEYPDTRLSDEARRYLQ